MRSDRNNGSLPLLTEFVTRSRKMSEGRLISDFDHSRRSQLICNQTTRMVLQTATAGIRTSDGKGNIQTSGKTPASGQEKHDPLHIEMVLDRMPGPEQHGMTIEF